MIRNFSIIAHVDHGKSTLADRFLELTGTVKKEEIGEQFLDQMDLEKERGITIKMQPCAMEYRFEGKTYQLNLIDTPGHMDFAYEVERALAAVEGAVLLVDVVSGVQAQTLANLYLAERQKLKIIPVINKIDICPSEEHLQRLKREVAGLVGVAQENVLAVSAKTGENVEKVLEAVVRQVPPPRQTAGLFKALVFDSLYDNYQGIIAHIRVFSGCLKKGSTVYFINQQKTVKAREVGVFRPYRFALPQLKQGEIGYIATGIKQASAVNIGDTITEQAENGSGAVSALPGYQEPKPLVFANVFPAEAGSFEALKASLDKLYLNDTSLSINPISNPYLGRGMRIGFLGMLHLEITIERLKREFQTVVVVTSPSVVFRAKLKSRPEQVLVHSVAELPGLAEIEEIEEPWVRLSVLTSQQYNSRVHQILEQKRAEFVCSEVLQGGGLLLHFKAPLSELIEDFLDKLKSATEGFASFSYEFAGYQKSDLVKLEFLISRELKPSFSRLVHRSKAAKQARDFLKKLKDVLPARNFSQSLQASVNNKIIAREDIRALRKDVTAPLYGGDFTRKKKLLQKQRKGKKQLAEKGKTPIPEHIYLKLIRR